MTKSYPPDITQDTLLGDAQIRMQAYYLKGIHCPLCAQLAKIYPRQLNRGMAVGAIKLWRWHRHHGTEKFAHLPTVVGRRSAEEAKLRYWGLIEEEMVLRPDGGRAGYWRLTEAGREWVLGHSSYPPYVMVYDTEPLGPPQFTDDTTGKTRDRPVTIRDALGRKFDYDELMRGEPAGVGDDE